MLLFPFAGALFRSRLSFVNDDSMTITMLEDRIDPDDSTPLHEQVAGLVRRAIADGEAGPDERLPPAKDLASVLGVNKHTVLRAMHILRDEGLVEFGRGAASRDRKAERGAVLRQVRDLVEFARRKGYRREDVIGMIEALPVSRYRWRCTAP